MCVKQCVFVSVNVFVFVREIVDTLQLIRRFLSVCVCVCVCV